jgi:hypothetical protein
MDLFHCTSTGLGAIFKDSFCSLRLHCRLIAELSWRVDAALLPTLILL